MTPAMMEEPAAEETPPAFETETQPEPTAAPEASPEATKPVPRARRRVGTPTKAKKSPAKTSSARAGAKPSTALATRRKAKSASASPASTKAGKPRKAGARKTRGKTATAWSSAKMLKDITARLDLSRRQLTAALDDLTTLVGRQIGAATAPIPRLVKGQWKTPDALGKLASKLGISGKDKPKTRKRAAAKATPVKAAPAKAKTRKAAATVSVSLRKRPARTRRTAASTTSS